MMTARSLDNLTSAIDNAAALGDAQRLRRMAEVLAACALRRGRLDLAHAASAVRYRAFAVRFRLSGAIHAACFHENMSEHALADLSDLLA